MPDNPEDRAIADQQYAARKQRESDLATARTYFALHPEDLTQSTTTDATGGMKPPTSPAEAQQQATAVEGKGAGASMQPIDSKAAEAIAGAPGDLTAEALQSAGMAPEHAATAGHVVD